MKLNLLVVLFVAAIANCVSAQSYTDKERMIALSMEINSPLDSVWSRWTTDAGRKKFFAPSSKFELTTLGYMEMLFMPQAPEGQRGAENNRVLSVQDKQMISFTWDAPPKYPEIRKQRTVVVIRFFKNGETKTIVTLHQMGWGTGKEWDEVFNYFSATWATFVLPNLKFSLEVKPIDWSNFPNNVPKGLKHAITLPN